MSTQEGELRSRVCTFALVVSSVLLTGLKLVFQEEDPFALERYKRKHEPKSKPLRKRKMSISSLPVRSNREQLIGRTRSVDGLSVSTCSSVSTAAGPNGWTTEVCGQLDKQSDVLGLWKQRYFRLASLSKHELSAFESLPKDLVLREDRVFLLLYWACDAPQAISQSFRFRPRGAFLLRGCEVQFEESTLTLTLSRVMDLIENNQRLVQVKLRASSLKSFHRWASTLHFASLFDSMRGINEISDEGQMGQRDVSDLEGVLGVSAHPSLESRFQFFFKLYSGVEQEESSAAVRVFLLAWRSERRARKYPITPEKIYDLGSCLVEIKRDFPCVVTVHNVKDLLVESTQQQQRFAHTGGHGKLVLRAASPAAAFIWANAMSPDPSRVEVDEAIFEQGREVQLDHQVDQNESRIPGEASISKRPANLLHMLSEWASFPRGNRANETNNKTSSSSKDTDVKGDETLVDQLVMRACVPKNRQAMGEKVVDELGEDDILLLNDRQRYVGKNDGEQRQEQTEEEADELFSLGKKKYSFGESNEYELGSLYDDDDDEAALLQSLSADYSPATRELLEPLSTGNLSPFSLEGQSPGRFDHDDAERMLNLSEPRNLVQHQDSTTRTGDMFRTYENVENQAGVSNARTAHLLPSVSHLKEREKEEALTSLQVDTSESVEAREWPGVQSGKLSPVREEAEDEDLKRFSFDSQSSFERWFARGRSGDPEMRGV